jgi:hypothetical protein
MANHHIEGTNAARPANKMPWQKYGAPLAIAGVAGGTAGLLMGPHDDEQKAAAIDEIAMADVASLGRFVNTPQPIRPRTAVQTAKTLSSREALGRILSSKNHQHHLNKKSPDERAKWVDAYHRRWVGDHHFHLSDVPLHKLDHKQVSTDPAKVHDIAKNWPPKDDGNYPVIGGYDGITPHIVLDGNHRVAAAKQVGAKSIKAYVRDDVAKDFNRTKEAYSCFVPVDLVGAPHYTTSFFPEDVEGHLMTSLRAAQMGDETMLTLLSALRGQEGTPHHNMVMREMLRSHK